MKARFTAISIVILLLISITCKKKSRKAESFPILEATIADIHKAIASGELTCRELTEIYLDRIDRYDQATKLNAVVALNPHALETAAKLDKEFRSTGKLRPLHGIPVIIKDNYETQDMPTTAGSEALLGFVPSDDAFQVRRLREAGAVILAKSNMGEWAFSPYETLSSSYGLTRNPYDLNRVPAGSSGGTAAAVAANLAMCGLGTDTGNSIRGPSSHCCLVGIRPTMGLTSRDGIIPLYRRNDIGGPMCRTVEDTARILNIISGPDQSDPITEKSKGMIPESYLPLLDREGLKGARIGVFRLYTERPSADKQINSLFEQALADMKSEGAVIIDPFTIPDFGHLTQGVWCNTFRRDLNEYLASLGERAPVRSLTEIYNKGLFLTRYKMRVYEALEAPPISESQCRDIYTEPKNITFREAVLQAMEDQGADVIVYPTWSNPPRKLTDFRSPAGDNSQLIPPHTGFPAISVPMGFVDGKLPAGLQIVGRLFSESQLLKIAYAYERATRHRRPPKKFME